MKNRRLTFLIPIAMILLVATLGSSETKEPAKNFEVSIVASEEMPPLPPSFSLPSGEPFCGAMSQMGPAIFGRPVLWLAETNGQRYLVAEMPVSHHVTVVAIPGESNGGCLPI